MNSRLLTFLIILYSFSAYGGSLQSCKVLDPDLAQGAYQGGCKDGLADGYGEINGVSSYRGDFLAGKKHGKGIKVMPNGDRYEGDFRDDYRQGHGVYVWGGKTPWAGNRYEGEYKRDLRDGHGIYQWASGDRYDGEWKSDLRMGQSVMELRRAQAAKAAEIDAKIMRAGSTVCAEEKWDGTNVQLIRGTIENIAERQVRVRVMEIEGGMANFEGATLSPGKLLTDEKSHWQNCLLN